jgi:hypothetical protein
MEVESLGKRRRVPTEKGLALQKATQIKDEKAKERARKRVEVAKTQEEVDELSSLFSRIGIDTTDQDLAAAFGQMGMGRRKKTKKHTKKYRGKTNRRRIHQI